LIKVYQDPQYTKVWYLKGIIFGIVLETHDRLAREEWINVTDIMQPTSIV
jgi:hypothetical protein